MTDRGWRGGLLVGLAVFLVGGGTTIAVGLAWAREVRSPRVVLLGSGSRLSVLVTDGDARLLIATGDDPVAFANALARARHPTTRRIDVLLVAGEGPFLVAPASLRDDPRVRLRASLGPLTGSAEAVALAGEGVAPLPSPRRIRLGDEVSVRVESAAVEPEGEVDGGAGAWRATVRRGATTVAILSDGRAAAAFDPLGPVSALVVAGTEPLAAWAAVDAPLLVVAGSDAVLSGKELRQGAARLFDDARTAIRVHPGEALPLRFVGAGLEAPAEPAQTVGATPPPAASRGTDRRRHGRGVPGRRSTPNSGRSGSRRRRGLVPQRRGRSPLRAVAVHAALAATSRANSALTSARRVDGESNSTPVKAIAFATRSAFAYPSGESAAATTSWECQVQTRSRIGKPVSSEGTR